MSKYDALAPLFDAQAHREVRVRIDELEAVLGFALPPSARRHAPWWGSGQPHARWVRWGWSAHPKLGEGAVVFTRAGSPRSHPAPPAGTPAAADAVLVGCVKTKRSARMPAKDLYDSTLWVWRRRYAEATQKPWAILSALHGLLDPDEEIDPYERHLASLPTGEIRAWSERTARDVVRWAQRHGAATIEIHAGAEYSEYGLADALRRERLAVLRPLEGLGLGEQLAWYAAPRRATQT